MIISLSELKAYLWITTTDQDTLLNIFIDSANDFVETYIWRELTSQEYTEYKDWDWQRIILLENYPVTTISSFQYNQWTIDEEDFVDVDDSTYKLSPKIWKIFLTFYQRRWFQNYKIVYTAWYSTIPWDLKLATLKLAAWYYNNKTSDWIKSETVWWDSITFDTTDISNDVLVILNNYRNV